MAERRRHRGVLAFGLFLLAALLVGGLVVWLLGWDWPLASRENPETENAYAEGDYTPLSFRVEGYVRRIAVTDFQHVATGQVLAELVDDDYRASVTQAQSNLDAASAELDRLRAQEQVLRLGIVQAEARNNGVQAEQLRATEEAKRQRVLLPTALGLQRNWETAEADRRRLAAEVVAGDAATEQRRREVDVLQAQEARAVAAIATRRAELDLARIRLGYTVLRAPRAHHAVARQVREGTLARPGTEIIALTPLGNVWVVANFTERQITDMQVGQAVRIRFDAFPDTPVRGHVFGLSPLTGGQLSPVPPDNTTGNFTKVVQRVPVKITLDPGGPLQGLVRPGMSGLARVETRGDEPVRPAR